jgi:hypothetical protein
MHGVIGERVKYGGTMVFWTGEIGVSFTGLEFTDNAIEMG